MSRATCERGLTERRGEPASAGRPARVGYRRPISIAIDATAIQAIQANIPKNATVASDATPADDAEPAEPAGRPAAQRRERRGDRHQSRADARRAEEEPADVVDREVGLGLRERAGLIGVMSMSGAVQTIKQSARHSVNAIPPIRIRSTRVPVAIPAEA